MKHQFMDQLSVFTFCSRFYFFRVMHLTSDFWHSRVGARLWGGSIFRGRDDLADNTSISYMRPIISENKASGEHRSRPGSALGSIFSREEPRGACMRPVAKLSHADRLKHSFLGGRLWRAMARESWPGGELFRSWCFWQALLCCC